MPKKRSTRRKAAPTSSSLAADGLDASPLGTLSPEIRNSIYELVLTRTEPFAIGITSMQTHLGKRIDKAELGCRGLLLTCKYISAECAQLFYAINRFIVTGSRKKNSFEALEIFSDKIGKLNAAAFRQVMLNVDFIDLLWDGQGLSGLKDSILLKQAVRPVETYRDCVFTINVRFTDFHNTLIIGIKDGVVLWGQVTKDIDDLLNGPRNWQIRALLVKARSEAARDAIPTADGI
ncbi:hypothetical protein LTR08_000948 [Meristemomyces frigidus]|nr:hypothetical protein LTR08_000948 [Meristemomyces frigidus]